MSKQIQTMMSKKIKNKKNFRLASSYLISSISITFVLLILGLFALLIMNIRDVSVSAKESVIISVVMKPDAKKGDIEYLQKSLALQPYCKNIKLITPKEALDDLIEDLGQDIADVLDTNPLPTTIVFNPTFEYSNSDSLQKVKKILSQIKIVDDVFYNQNLVYQLDKNVSKITLAFIILEILFLIMSMSLINNTVRLLIHSKRMEIKTMQMVGASKKFILKPFLANSFIHGLFCSLISIAVIIGGILYYQSAAEDIVKIGHLAEVIGLNLFAGLGITSLATYYAVTNYLKRSKEEIM